MTEFRASSGLNGPCPHRHWPVTEHMAAQRYSIRDFSRELIALLDQYGGNLALAYDAALPIVGRLLAKLDLVDLGVPRQGNHAARSQWLYYDYELEVQLSTFEKGVTVPAHDHGTWELIAPYRGELEYASFRRVDDGSLEGFAELEVKEQRTLYPGDAAVCGPPPNDIHAFAAKTDDVVLLGMNHGPLAPTRAYFDTVAKTYELRDSKDWRLGIADSPPAPVCEPAS